MQAALELVESTMGDQSNPANASKGEFGTHETEPANQKIKEPSTRGSNRANRPDDNTEDERPSDAVPLEFKENDFALAAEQAPIYRDGTILCLLLRTLSAQAQVDTVRSSN